MCTNVLIPNLQGAHDLPEWTVIIEGVLGGGAYGTTYKGRVVPAQQESFLRHRMNQRRIPYDVPRDCCFKLMLTKHAVAEVAGIEGATRANRENGCIVKLLGVAVGGSLGKNFPDDHRGGKSWTNVLACLLEEAPSKVDPVKWTVLGGYLCVYRGERGGGVGLWSS